MYNTWLHQQRAGLSKTAFDALTVSESHFYCSHFWLMNYESQLSDRQESVKFLNQVQAWFPEIIFQKVCVCVCVCVCLYVCLSAPT